MKDSIKATAETLIVSTIDMIQHELDEGNVQFDAVNRTEYLVSYLKAALSML